MDTLEKQENFNELFTLYGQLLTDKQQSYFKHYYLLDHSLHEIAEHFQVSRNAVYDQLKVAANHLLMYEEKLNLLKDLKQRRAYLQQYEITKDPKYLELIRKMDE